MAQLLIKGTKVAEVVGDTTSLIANTLYHPSGTQIITDDGGTVGLTNVNLQNINFDNVANNSISGDKIYGGTISGSLLHTDVTFADVNSSIANDSISGDKIHGGTISGFQSTGITDNSSNTVITVHSNGNVGIGPNSSDEKLEISNTSGKTVVKTSVAANSTVGLEIEKTGSTTQSWLIADGVTANGKLEFYNITDSRSIMTMINTGYVGIGTVSPSEKLHVDGDAYFTGGMPYSYRGLLSGTIVTNSSGNATLYLSGWGWAASASYRRVFFVMLGISLESENYVGHWIGSIYHGSSSAMLSSSSTVGSSTYGTISFGSNGSLGHRYFILSGLPAEKTFNYTIKGMNPNSYYASTYGVF